MRHFENFIGIDVSKDTLDFALLAKKLEQPKYFKCVNSEAGLKTFKQQLSKCGVGLNSKTVLVLESCGMYDRRLIDFARTRKCAVSIENPSRIKKSIGLQLGKNDQLDALRIAQYAHRFQDRLHLWNHPRSSLVILKDLLNNRERFLRCKQQLEIPLDGFKQFYKAQEWRLLNRINKQALLGLGISLQQLEKTIDTLVSEDVHISRQACLLRSIPGIGRITALSLISYTHGFDGWSAYGLGKYAGVIPFAYSSGHIIRKPHVSKCANLRLKRYLHMAAISAINTKGGELRKFYDRMVLKGKRKMSVLNAIRFKLILRAVAVIRQDKPYDPNYNYVKQSLLKRDPQLPLIGLA